MKLNRIDHNGRAIDYEVTHRPAVTRRLHLEVGKKGQLQVVAPRGMSRRAIQKTLQHRAPYVARFLARARSRQRDLPELNYASGEEHWYLGQRFPLEVIEQPGKRASVELSGGRIRLVVPEAGAERTRHSLEGWYRRQAQRYFELRLIDYSQAAAWTDQPPPMRLRRMKRTWGSCSSRGMITLNPQLIKAPELSIDYVIAHEVCHLGEHNHGKAFYALQEQLFPRWREARDHLTQKGHRYLHR
jgi:predicted metal-dependent hydrolase